LVGESPLERRLHNLARSPNYTGSKAIPSKRRMVLPHALRRRNERRDSDPKRGAACRDIETS
jgi:hypothetical protein